MATESANKVVLTGKVVEISHSKGTNKNQESYISGRVMLETGPDNIIPLEFYQNEFKKNSKTPNQVYKGLETLIAETKTIAKDGREAADVVSVTSGQIGENSFYGTGGGLVRGFRIASPFYNRKPGAEPENQFIVSGIVLNMADEIKGDLPTGRLFIDILVIGYNNRGEVVRLTVEDEKGVSYMKNSVSLDDDVKFAGHVVIAETKTEKIETAAFGDPIVQIETKVEKKLLVTSVAASTSSTLPADEKESILAEREGRLAKAKEEYEKKSKGNGSGTTAKSAGTNRNFSL